MSDEEFNDLLNKYSTECDSIGNQIDDVGFDNLIKKYKLSLDITLRNNYNILV